VYTHPDLEFVKTIPVGREPNWITFGPDSRFAYVGCRGSNEVSVIDLHSLAEIKRVATGGEGSARLKVVDVPERDATAGE
jgi:YVTN family beta-propeller protein